MKVLIRLVMLLMIGIGLSLPVKAVQTESGWIYVERQDDSGQYHLLQVRPDGGDVRQLTALDERHQIVVVTEAWIYLRNFDITSPFVARLRPDGADFEIVASVTFAALSPDGETLYGWEGQRLQHIPLGGGDTVTLAEFYRLGDSTLQLSPDGEWLYVAAQQFTDDFAVRIYRMRNDGTELQVVSPTDSDAAYTLNAVTENWVYYSDFRSIYRVRHDGSEEEVIASDDETYVQNPTPNPVDDSDVIFLEYPPQSLTQLVRFHPGGNRALTDSVVTDSFIANSTLPFWSPDGTQLVFSKSAVEDFGNIWTINLTTETAHWVAYTSYTEKTPRWSPDGEWIYYVSTDSDYDTDLFRVRPDYSDTMRVIENVLPTGAMFFG